MSGNARRFARGRAGVAKAVRVRAAVRPTDDEFALFAPLREWWDGRTRSEFPADNQVPLDLAVQVADAIAYLEGRQPTG
jgi:hypothetical protein